MKGLFYFLPFLLFVACSQPADKDSNENKNMDMKKQGKADPDLMSMFEMVNVVKMHLFSTNEAAPNPEDYPYTGKLLTDKVLSSLEEGLQPSEGGSVYACYYTENSGHYILRKSDKDASNTLLIAKWDDEKGELTKVADLAYLMCEDGTCQQQDAWLADLDDNRALELIIRRHTRDSQRNISEEHFEVLTDKGAGVFEKTNEQLASLAVKDNYVMQ